MKKRAGIASAGTLSFNLTVPFDLTVFAEEEPAKPGEMHAI